MFLIFEFTDFPPVLQSFLLREALPLFWVWIEISCIKPLKRNGGNQLKMVKSSPTGDCLGLASGTVCLACRCRFKSTVHFPKSGCPSLLAIEQVTRQRWQRSICICQEVKMQNNEFLF